MKKIILSTVSFPARSETFIYEKFKRLPQLGWDIHVVANTITSHERSGLTLSSEDLKRVHTIWDSYNKWPSFFGSLFHHILLCLVLNPVGTIRYLVLGWGKFKTKLFKKFVLDMPYIYLKPDVIHFEFGTQARDKLYLKKLLRNIKCSTSFRGYDLDFVGLEDPDFYQKVWRDSNGFHFLGSYLYQQAKRRGYQEEQFYRLIPPALDIAFFEPGERMGKNNGVTQIVSVGRLTWKKGYFHAFKALKELADQGRDFHYHIVGEGEEIRVLAFLRHSLGLEEKITFHLGKSREDIRELLKSADVFLHCAVSEGFCNAVLEAQAMKVPVVTSDAGGLPENVVNRETGIVVPRRDTKRFAEAILELMNDPKLRQRMGDAGRRRIQEHFRIEDQMNSWDAFYKKLTDEE